MMINPKDVINPTNSTEVPNGCYNSIKHTFDDNYHHLCKEKLYLSDNHHQDSQDNADKNDLKQFKIEGMVISYNGKRLNLEKKQLVFRLVQIFIINNFSNLSKNQIVSSIYNLDLNSISIRQRYCQIHNAGKLIARARTLLRDHLDDVDKPKWNWIVYDSKQESYRFITKK